MQPLLITKDKGPYTHFRHVEFSREPLSLLEIDIAIRQRMQQHGRLLTIHVGVYNQEIPVWAEKVYYWIVTLSQIYHPWQFRVIRPSNNLYELDWVEVDSYLHKYGCIVPKRRRW